jgi:Uma2 family endonuclease
MNIATLPRMTVDEFLSWSVRQPEGRFELEDGRVVLQKAQNVAHLRAKARIFQVLDKAVAAAGLPFYVLPDGATVRLGPRTAYEPDALVAPLPMPPDTALEVDNPVIVVEVLSPSSVTRDLADKVASYGRHATIAHYLVLDPVEKAILWHARAGGGAAGFAPPTTWRTGTLRLMPPGLAFDVAEVFG